MTCTGVTFFGSIGAFIPYLSVMRVLCRGQTRAASAFEAIVKMGGRHSRITVPPPVLTGSGSMGCRAASKAFAMGDQRDLSRMPAAPLGRQDNRAKGPQMQWT